MAKYTPKQMGDACEMLVAAELTLAGVPAMKASDYWPGYDVIAQPHGKPPQRISVKSRTFKRGAAFVTYSDRDVFEWLAIVILPGGDCTTRRIFVVPRRVADAEARTYKTEATRGLREFRIDEVERKFAAYEGNFGQNEVGMAPGSAVAGERSASCREASAGSARTSSVTLDTRRSRA